MIYNRRNCRPCSHGSWIVRHKAKVLIAKTKKASFWNTWRSKDNIKERPWRYPDRYRWWTLKRVYWERN